MNIDPELIRAVREAIAAGEVTAGGKPRADALESRLGRTVSAAERDAAFLEVTQGTEPAPTVEQSQPVESQASEALVYVGPALTGDFHVQQFTVFKNGLPETLRAAREADKALARLFVPVADLAKARGLLARAESSLAGAFRETVRKYRERRAKA